MHLCFHAAVAYVAVLECTTDVPPSPSAPMCFACVPACVCAACMYFCARSPPSMHYIFARRSNGSPGSAASPFSSLSALPLQLRSHIFAAALVEESRRELENAWPGIFLLLLDFCEATDYSVMSACKKRGCHWKDRKKLCAQMLALELAYALSPHPPIHSPARSPTNPPTHPRIHPPSHPPTAFPKGPINFLS